MDLPSLTGDLCTALHRATAEEPTTKGQALVAWAVPSKTSAGGGPSVSMQQFWGGCDCAKTSTKARTSGTACAVTSDRFQNFCWVTGTGGCTLPALPRWCSASIHSLIQPAHFPFPGLEQKPPNASSPENKTNPCPQTSSSRLSYPTSVSRAEPHFLDQPPNVKNSAPFLAPYLPFPCLPVSDQHRQTLVAAQRSDRHRHYHLELQASHFPA